MITFPGFDHVTLTHLTETSKLWMNVTPSPAETTWRDSAACRDTDPESFFDERMFPELRRSFCQQCPVRGDCLQEALNNRDAGLWGGTSQQARNAILRGRPRRACPSCRNREIVTDDTIQACSACKLSWPLYARKSGLPDRPTRSVFSASAQASQSRQELRSTA